MRPAAGPSSSTGPKPESAFPIQRAGSTTRPSPPTRSTTRFAGCWRIASCTWQLRAAGLWRGSRSTRGSTAMQCCSASWWAAPVEDERLVGVELRRFGEVPFELADRTLLELDEACVGQRVAQGVGVVDEL